MPWVESEGDGKHGGRKEGMGEGKTPGLHGDCVRGWVVSSCDGD